MAHHSFASPKRTSAIVVEIDKQGGCALCKLIDLQGFLPTRNIGPPAPCTYARWSPDGSTMCFIATVVAGSCSPGSVYSGYRRVGPRINLRFMADSMTGRVPRLCRRAGHMPGKEAAAFARFPLRLEQNGRCPSAGRRGTHPQRENRVLHAQESDLYRQAEPARHLPQRSSHGRSAHPASVAHFRLQLQELHALWNGSGGRCKRRFSIALARDSLQAPLPSGLPWLFR